MKKANDSTFNVCFVISIILHVFVFLIFPASWSSGGGLNIYAIESYGITDGSPFEASIAYRETQQQSAPSTTKTTVTTSTQEAKKAPDPKPATKPEPEPPKPELPKSEPPKNETPLKPEPKSEPPNEAQQEEAPSIVEEPKADVSEPSKADEADVVTTTNPDAEVSIPVKEPEEKKPEPTEEQVPEEEPGLKEQQSTDSTGAQVQGEESSGGSDIGQGDVEEPPAPRMVTVKGSSLFLGGFGVVYPKDAVAEKARGVVKLDIRVNSDGSLIGVDIVQSSGYRSLDEQAMYTVSQGPFEARGQAYVLPAEVIFPDVGIDARVSFGDVVFRED